jgi:hypothetical protein
MAYYLGMSTLNHDPNKIIDALGGTNAVARLCEIAPGSVSDWRKTGIPKARLMFLKLARPGVFKNHTKKAAQEAAE